MSSPVRPERSMRVLLLRLWHHLSKRRRRQFVILLLLMLVSGFAEVISLGAVLPFLAILTAPDRVFQYPIVARVAETLGWTSPDQLLLPLTGVFVGAALIAGAIRLLMAWTSTRLAYASGADLSIDVYRRTLYQPYRVHLARNSSEVVTGIAIKVSGSVGILTSVLILLSSAVVVVAIMLGLLAINTKVAFQAIFGFGASYLLITLIDRRRLRRNSQRIAAEQTHVVKALQEGLGGIRDVLLDGTQEMYCDVYRRADAPLRRAQSSNVFISVSPRHVMESVAMILIALLAYGLSDAPGGLTRSLPVLGALALGGQRLLPALQQAYSAWAAMTGAQASLADTIDLLDQPLPAEMLLAPPEPLALRSQVHLKGIRFRYNPDGPWVVDGLDLVIPKGSRIGFAGTTGSGKSTTLDILMGLLEPTEGELVVDGVPIVGARVRAWQRSIAHVPQSIFLADTTLAENIAFGVPREKIDMEQVQEAARHAQIADFIESRPLGYRALVGERGVRLSGGQRQRVGIARALYKRASVLVFDEATSALDNDTEQSVMDAIEGFHRDLTILMIAHRLTTVRRCDTIVELEHGRVVAQGTFDQLLERSQTFRSKARALG